MGHETHIYISPLIMDLSEKAHICPLDKISTPGCPTLVAFFATGWGFSPPIRFLFPEHLTILFPRPEPVSSNPAYDDPVCPGVSNAFRKRAVFTSSLSVAATARLA